MFYDIMQHRNVLSKEYFEKIEFQSEKKMKKSEIKNENHSEKMFVNFVLRVIFYFSPFIKIILKHFRII